MKDYSVVEKIKRARQLEAESRWQEAAKLWRQVGNFSGAEACNLIVTSRAIGDNIRNELFKEKVQSLMEEMYGLELNDYEGAIGNLDQDHYTPEEWCDWYGEKYGLEKLI